MQHPRDLYPPDVYKLLFGGDTVATGTVVSADLSHVTINRTDTIELSPAPPATPGPRNRAERRASHRRTRR